MKEGNGSETTQKGGKDRVQGGMERRKRVLQQGKTKKKTKEDKEKRGVKRRRVDIRGMTEGRILWKRRKYKNGTIKDEGGVRREKERKENEKQR